MSLVVKFLILVISLSSLINCQCIYHTIQSGDTFNDLGKKYKVDPEAIVTANPSLNPYNLAIGQQVCIPTYATTTSTTTTLNAGAYDGFVPGCLNYQIRSGDNCASLASATSNNFYQLNPTINCENIFVGQWVCLPYTGNCGTRSYQVVSGDTCERIALKLGTTTDYLTRCNNINCSTLYINQVLKY
ncbi:peptidoglycan-binding [Brachionus plicatilis]|uniref:Peptidoglycan-binding n=1 Tax=Brachionus plicatilis TaxID=10195 RepID=A0A3M7RNE1_BRAPC|nr:peptidoglycan-binding [Brachionus plicatilis]